MSKKMLSDQLRQLIAECGLTRVEVCHRIGIDQGSLSNFMAGRRGLQMDKVDKLCAELELELVSKAKLKNKGRHK